MNAHAHIQAGYPGCSRTRPSHWPSHRPSQSTHPHICSRMAIGSRIGSCIGSCLHRLPLSHASALASALATRLRAYGARVVSLESVSCLLVGAPRAPPTSAGAITAAPPTPRANPSAPSIIQTTELYKGLAAPGPPRCEDARTLPTAPASRLHSDPSHFICSSIHCSRIAALHLHHKQLSSQTACLICRSPILLHRSPTFAA